MKELNDFECYATVEAINYYIDTHTISSKQDAILVCMLIKAKNKLNERTY